MYHFRKTMSRTDNAKLFDHLTGKEWKERLVKFETWYI